MQDGSHVRRSAPRHWPSHVRPIAGEELEHLAIDPSSGELYYDGKRLQQHHTHSLSGFERWLAIAVAASAVIWATVQVGRVAYRLIL